MTTMQWDPTQYLTYGDHRLRPFVELMNRVLAENPANIVDLGCGPGNATVLLTERWPAASVVGVDNSEEMIADAKPREIAGRLRFAHGDAYSVASASPIDLLISNATLQWVPGHLQEFSRYIETLTALGCDVDAWETTYFQLLEGDDAVFEWVKGSSLRPFIGALDETDGAAFVALVKAGLAKAYPKGPSGTIYPFRRVFVVAHKKANQDESAFAR